MKNIIVLSLMVISCVSAQGFGKRKQGESCQPNEEDWRYDFDSSFNTAQDYNFCEKGLVCATPESLTF